MAKTQNPAPTPDASSSSGGGAAGNWTTLLQFLRKFANVKDIFHVSFSLPATLCDPVSGLEYYHHMDVPEFFVRIGDPEDPLERMINVVAYYISYQLKFASDRLVKPYNPVIGEQFKAQWQVLEENDSNPDLDRNSTVYYHAEQIEHRPPITAFHYTCPERGVEMGGVNIPQASFSGTAFKVNAASGFKGLYVKLAHRDNEEYNIMLPTVNIYFTMTGIRMGFTDTVVVTCGKTGMKAELTFKEEKHLMIDISRQVATKMYVKPLDQQNEWESRRVWAGLTKALHSRDATTANKQKHMVEEDQRRRIAEMKKMGVAYVPRLLEISPEGRVTVKKVEVEEEEEEEVEEVNGTREEDGDVGEQTDVGTSATSSGRSSLVEPRDKQVETFSDPDEITLVGVEGH
ncbi:hypothetical protein HK102_014153 [Quaeritorhiza haematococci]|nr:hypothetical protein HK102_014153 [Quaeritorhiza haematococci]